MIMICRRDESKMPNKPPEKGREGPFANRICICVASQGLRYSDLCTKGLYIRLLFGYICMYI